MNWQNNDRMKETDISACYVTPSLSTEQYIPNHVFSYQVLGSMIAYDGNKEYKTKPGDYGIGRRNHLVRYTKQPDNGVFKKIYILFSQDFLKTFNTIYKFATDSEKTTGGIIPLKKDPLVKHFIDSLIPYFDEKGVIEEQILNVKRTELLLILLKQNPGLASVLFDFRDPAKIDLEKFMNRNFKFNVSIERFAYLTGRSLSAFKRDFEKTFNASPSHWLVQKRLEEAHYLIEKKNKKPSEIYLELGFEDLSHFSFAFKKLYGVAPNHLKK